MKAHLSSRAVQNPGRLVDGITREDEALPDLGPGMVRCGCGQAVKLHSRSSSAVLAHRTPTGRRCPQRRVYPTDLRVVLAELPPVVFRGRVVTSSADMAAAEAESRSEAARRGAATRRQGDDDLPHPSEPLPPSSDPRYGRLARRQRVWLRSRER